MKRKPEIVIISGIRLGSDACRANELIQYLKSIRPTTLILNGGVFDVQGKSVRRFPKTHLKVLRYVLKMAADGTRVWYVAGLGDQFLSAFGELSLGQIEFREKLVLQLGGLKYMIYPGETEAGPGFFEKTAQKIRSWTGWRTFKKHQVLVENAVRLAQKANCEAIICANPYRPRIRESVSAIQYLNTGVWSENCSALEFNFSKWSLFTYHPADFEVKNPKLTVKKSASDDENAAFKSEDWSVYQTGI